ncbi:TPA: undecaprenyl-phosphate glucose phosphotransferase [Escherichia coli]|nr:undecaprenyl-phosphate glucose phosphotransferase [Escherichia coli]
MTIYQHRFRSNANASIISMLQRFSDILIIFLGIYFSCFINDHFFNLHYVLMALVALVIFQMIGGITDFYRSWRGVEFSVELILILKNWSFSFLLTLGFVTLFSYFNFTVRTFIFWYLAVCAGFVVTRSLIRALAGFFRRIGYNKRRVAFAGSLPAGISLLETFRKQPWLGFEVKGIYEDSFSGTYDLELYAGKVSDLICEARKGTIDRIYIAMHMRDEVAIKNMVSRLTDTTCSVLYITDVFTFNILQSRTEEINGVPIVPLFDSPLNGINMVFKRLEDIIVSSLILILISPILLVIATAVKTTSKGPVIFRQVRYGMDGKPIKVWKFRSMTVMENDDKVIQATKNDIRVTKVGKFLRSTSLDELPQFFNVLFGQMSVVGPRPHAVSHNEQYRSLIQGYMLRHKVKPGITGLAQINGWRGETDTLEKMEKRIEYDLLYIRGWSIWLDLKIIFLTVFKGFINKSAY